MTDDTFLFPGRENRSDRPGLKFRIKVERWERREGGREGRIVRVKIAGVKATLKPWTTKA